jgi:LacI family transcriptional regulator
MASRPTISDVAEAARVSISTVSLVMNGKGPVADATRLRVKAAADRLGYTPSRSARGLAARRTDNIGFVLRDDHFRRSEPFYTRVLLGAEFEARRRGLYVLLSTVPETYDPAQHAPRFLTEHSVDGVVVAGGVDEALLEQLHAQSIPFVLADYAWKATPTVQADNRAGAEAVAAHFLARGHRRVGFLGADPGHPSPTARRDAFLAAMAAAGHPVADAHVVVAEGPSDRPTGTAAAAALLDGDRPTAVFCANDALALGLMDAAVERVLAIPDDLAVAGFDDVDGAALAKPPLTTVRIHKETLGETALGLLAEGLTGAVEDIPPRTLVPTELVVRASA